MGSLSLPYGLTLVDALVTGKHLIQFCPQLILKHLDKPGDGSPKQQLSTHQKHSKVKLPGFAAGTLPHSVIFIIFALGVIKKLNLPLVPDHVKGHRDETRDNNNLPWQAKLDCDCDHMAGSSQQCQLTALSQYSS